jgi:hypothetical protein
MVNYYLGKSPFYNNEVIEKVIIEKIDGVKLIVKKE